MVKLHLILLAMLAILIASCAPEQNTPNNNVTQTPTIIYTTYGGFVPVEQAIRTLTVNATTATLQIFNSENELQVEYSRPITQDMYNELIALIGDFESFQNQYPANPEVLVIADVGSSNITVVNGTATKTIVIHHEYDPELPSQLENLLEQLMQTVAYVAPQDENNYALLIFEPMQCDPTPWDAWYEQGNIQFVQEPSLSDLVTAYYSQEHTIEMRSVERVQREGAVCEACSVCPEGYYIIAQVPIEDVNTMLELGWTEELNTSEN